jgi:hypothetical protein
MTVVDGIAPHTAPRRRIPHDLFVATCILVVAVAAGATALWIGRDDVTHATRPSHFAVTQTVAAVPRVVGMDVFTAAGVLVRLRLNVSTVSRAAPHTRQGIVLAVSPPPGSQVREGTTVVLTFASGH